MNDLSSNPYDRRDRPRPQYGAVDGAYGYDENAMLTPPFVAGIEIGDLHALASSAAHRGRVEAEARLNADYLAALQDARREAWEEGRTAGYAVAINDLLSKIDRQFGDRANDATKAIDLVLADRRITKDDLRRTLSAVGVLIYDLITAHHERFDARKLSKS